MFWTDRGKGTSPRYATLPSWTGVLDWIAAHGPVVAHNIGLSLGSAEHTDDEYIGQIASWHERYGFAWHSDHLSFVDVVGAHLGDEHNAGVPVPVPFDEEILDLISGRIEAVQAAIPAAFLVENSVAFIQIPGQDMSEPQFLNRLTERTGCGLLLDLHNLYANARNHHFDTDEFLAELDLSRVVEIHIAGGGELAGMWTDAHSGPPPPPVWELLRQVAPAAPNLRGVTFEFHDSYFPAMGEKGVRHQLELARAAWNPHR